MRTEITKVDTKYKDQILNINKKVMRGGFKKTGGIL